MTQKRNPISIRLGRVMNWQSIENNITKEITDIKENLLIRQYLIGVLQKKNINFGDIEIIKKDKLLLLNILVDPYCSELSNDEYITICKEIRTILNKYKVLQIKVSLIRSIDDNINDIYWNASYIANKIRLYLEQRKRIKDLFKILNKKVKSDKKIGYKIILAGRITSSARSKKIKKIIGKLPIGRLDNYIEYGSSSAILQSGKVGIKVLICKG